jgi:ribosome biogenesis protein YTM1
LTFIIKKLFIIIFSVFYSIKKIVDDEEFTFLSASQDRTIRAWRSSLEHNKYISLYECIGHKGSIESIAVSPSCSEVI